MYREHVALYARAWVEIMQSSALTGSAIVALYARAWVEIAGGGIYRRVPAVALYARAWVEILSASSRSTSP